MSAMVASGATATTRPQEDEFQGPGENDRGKHRGPPPCQGRLCDGNAEGQTHGQQTHHRGKTEADCCCDVPGLSQGMVTKRELNGLGLHTAIVGRFA